MTSVDQPDVDVGLLSAALDAAPDGIVIVAPEGTIVYANSQLHTLFGYPNGELVGEPVEVLVPEPSRNVHVQHRAAYFAEPRVRDMGVGRRLHGRRRDGSEFLVQISLSPVTSDGRTLTVAAVRDVTRHIAVEEANQQQALLDDRERIGHDLHDHIIQRLFAAGLSLQSTAMRADGLVAQRILEAVDQIDAAITDIRTAIFAMSQRTVVGTLRQRVLELVGQTERILRHKPTLSISGPADSGTSDELQDDVLAVLREALSNVARHAQATATHIRLDATDAAISLCVEDNGVGLPADVAAGGNGLRNIAARAERHSGSASAIRRPGGGTIVTWEASLRS